MPNDKTTISALLASLSEAERASLSWGDRGGGLRWQARCLGVSTIGNGGPYQTAKDAIKAVLEQVRP